MAQRELHRLDAAECLCPLLRIELDRLDLRRIERAVAGRRWAAASIASTASIPSVTWPNTVCLPSSHGALRRGDDEELRAVGVRAGVGHRQRAANDLVLVDLVLELVARTARARPLRAAALDHEVGDHAMEDEAVVEVVGGELAEVIDRLGRVVVEQLDARSCRGWCSCWLCSCAATPTGRRFSLVRSRAGSSWPRISVPLDALDDALCLDLGHLDEGEPLEHSDVAHRLAVEAGRGGDRVDDVGRLESGRRGRRR